MSTRKGLKFEMFQFIKKRKHTNNTEKNYKKHARYFCEYIKEKGYTANMVRKEPQKYIQEYTDYLVADEKAATTIHTYISFICTFFGIDMAEISKPKRETHLITKSRDNDTNKQGDREENNFDNYFNGKTRENKYSDNDCCRMAAFYVQDGRCYVTGMILRTGERQLHHRLPKSKGGKDTPENLIFLESRVHKMVHTNNYDEYWNLEKELNLTAAQSKMVEQLRYEAGSYFYV